MRGRRRKYAAPCASAIFLKTTSRYVVRDAFYNRYPSIPHGNGLSSSAPSNKVRGTSSCQHQREAAPGNSCLSQLSYSHRTPRIARNSGSWRTTARIAQGTKRSSRPPASVVTLDTGPTGSSAYASGDRPTLRGTARVSPTSEPSMPTTPSNPLSGTSSSERPATSRADREVMAPDAQGDRHAISA